MKEVLLLGKIGCMFGLFYQLHALHAGPGTYILAVISVLTWTITKDGKKISV